MALLKVTTELMVIGIIVLLPISFTKVTPEVFVFQVEEQSISIKEVLPTKLTQRMSLVGTVMGIALPHVSLQLPTAVQLVLMGE